jgi:hypothetical protein
VLSHQLIPVCYHISWYQCAITSVDASVLSHQLIPLCYHISWCQCAITSVDASVLSHQLMPVCYRISWYQCAITSVDASVLSHQLMPVCYHISMFCNMLNYTTVLQRNTRKDDVKTIPTIRTTVSTSKVQIYKGSKTAWLLNVAATCGQMHSLLQEHFKFPTSLTIANAHHMLLLQLLLQQQAVLVTCIQVLFFIPWWMAMLTPVRAWSSCGRWLTPRNRIPPSRAGPEILWDTEVH